MPKFLVIYHANEDAAEMMANATPEDMQKGMEPWMAWAAKCGDKLVDMGSPLGNGMSVTESGASKADTTVTGYSMLEADSLDDAVKLLEDHPHIGWTEGCSIEVHEGFPLPGM